MPDDELVVSYRWVVLGIGLFAMTAGAAYAQGLASITPALRAHYGIQLGTIGVLLGAVSLGITPAVLPWGLAADRWGERPVMAVGMLSAAASLVLLAQQRHLAAVVGLLVAGGAASASVNAASGRAVMQWFPAKGRGLAMAIRQTSSPLGAGLAAVVLPPFARAYGVPAVYYLLAAFCTSSAIAVLLFMRPAPPAQPAVPKATPHPIDSPDPTRATSPSEASRPTRASRPRSVLRDRRLWIVSFAAGLLVVPQFALTALLVEYLTTAQAVTVSAAALVLAVAQAGGAVARLVNGAWTDRTTERIGPLAIVAGLIAAGCAAVVATAGAPTPAVIIVIVLAATLAISWNGMANLVAAELAGPEQTGAAIGLENTLAFLAAAATPPVLAVIITHTSWTVGHVIPGVASVIACILLIRVRRQIRIAGNQAELPTSAVARSGQ
ncbi:MFS transporter [Kribbella sp. NBC_01245]|uniref:MFS transporter n=1 Tax=Kribbella sp. NBC_01245 TaxID=2903578 RepID=UPI002E27F564|nr:MFS transporter [Kribbella sp. NBC_01245]